MPTKKIKKTRLCDRCADAQTEKNAKYKCLQCREKMCSECTQYHMILRPCLDFRIIDLNSGKSVDSVFSLEPDKDEKETEKGKSPGDEDVKASGNRFQIVRTFGKPILPLTMQKSYTIQVPITPTLQSSSGSTKQFSLNNTVTRRQKSDIPQKQLVNTLSYQGDFNENGDFFPSTVSDEPNSKPSILKRTSSFKSDNSEYLWAIEIPSNSSQANSQPIKKEVRFNTSMNTINEEPNGIVREYSNNFYQKLGQNNSKKTIETVKPVSKPVKRIKRTMAAGLSMVSQCSIVIKQKEIAGKISAVLFLNDNYLIVLDRVNHKMKVFNSKDRYRMVIDQKIPKGSWGLTSPEDNIIAMTCRNKIIFYGLFELKTPRYEKPQDPVVNSLDVIYRLRASCYGISFCESRDIFFVACNVFFSDPCIFVIDTKGCTQQIIRTIDDGVSPSIPFSETLRVDSDRGVFYIGDRFGKRIVCATYDGKHIWSVPLVGKPVSITDDADHIYVCVNGKQICIIHKDGRFVKNIINLDLDGRRICYHDQTNQLVILTKAFWGVSHFIQIYQL